MLCDVTIVNRNFGELCPRVRRGKRNNSGNSETAGRRVEIAGEGENDGEGGEREITVVRN